MLNKTEYSVKPIGTVHSGRDGFYIEVSPEYRQALTGLEGFGCIQALWWFSRTDGARDRLVERRPYKKGPAELGVFATRSPARPNPIALSTCFVTFLDAERGLVGLAWIDAEDGTPVLDIKPYTPSLDRVQAPAVPGWCAHWPESVEQSGDFDWSGEFNF